MTYQDRKLSATAGEDNANSATSRYNGYDAQSRLQDPFLFYSIPENLRNVLTFQTVDHTSENFSYNDTQIVRETRISVEKDPLTLMMEDEGFRTELGYRGTLQMLSDTERISSSAQ